MKLSNVSIINYESTIVKKNIKFVWDFKKLLIKVIKTEFNKSKINGCFFHYVKELWKKAKTLGIAKLRLKKSLTGLRYTKKIIIKHIKINNLSIVILSSADSENDFRNNTVKGNK